MYSERTNWGHISSAGKVVDLAKERDDNFGNCVLGDSPITWDKRNILQFSRLIWKGQIRDILSVKSFKTFNALKNETQSFHQQISLYCIYNHRFVKDKLRTYFLHWKNKEKHCWYKVTLDLPCVFSVHAYIS